jgi:DNA-binding transcriptional MerR regulator
MRLKKTYGSREVAALTGLSARQLQVWDAGGLLSPSVPSHPTAAGGYTERRYTPIELFELLVLADLRRRGFTVQQLRELQRILHEQFGHRLFEATGGGGSVQLLTDGCEIYARTSSGAFFNVLKTPAQPLLVVGDEGLLKDLGASIRPRRRSRKPHASRRKPRASGRKPQASSRKPQASGKPRASSLEAHASSGKREPQAPGSARNEV